MKTFMHTFKTPINEYTALAVLNGMNPVPVLSYEGRLCYVASTARIHGGKGRNYHNRCHVCFLDGGWESIPAGKFNSKAKLVGGAV